MIEKAQRFSLVPIIALTIILIGCAGITKNFGKFTPDEQAKITFESFQIDTNYRYYISGGDVYPIAILALDKTYTMGNDLWKEMSFTKDTLQQTVANMQMRIRECCLTSHFGFAVYDSKGKKIGILYTYLGLGIAIKVEENNIIHMYGPTDDEQLKRYQDRISSRVF